jgi:hypothetical protein
VSLYLLIVRDGGSLEDKEVAMPPADLSNFTLCRLLRALQTSFFSCALHWDVLCELRSPTMVVETFGIDSVKSTLTTDFDSLWLLHDKGSASGMVAHIST